MRAFICLILFSSVAFGQLPSGDKLPFQTPTFWDQQKLESYLAQHPKNEANRENALEWYRDRYQADLGPLKRHTALMVRYHPGNLKIYLANSAAFYAHPEYRNEVITLLEASLKEQERVSAVDHRLLFNLALICQQGTIASSSDPAARARFLTYEGLPVGTLLPSQIDNAMAFKSIHYWRAAIAAAHGNNFSSAFYSTQLASLLRYLGRNSEALKVCETALPGADQVAKPGLLLAYGRCLRVAGRIAQAKQVFGQIRGIDNEWSEGPGRSTMEAETQLGLMAFSEGDVAGACKNLLSSLKVKENNIRGTNGLPIGFPLAQKLFEAGQNKTVFEYCRIILGKFWVNQKETQELMNQALKAGGVKAISTSSGGK